LIEWQKVDKENAAFTYESMSKAFSDDGNCSDDGLHLVIEEAKKSAKVSREVPINQVADPSILREAQRELGIR
jgi:hypothetical protein